VRLPSRSALEQGQHVMTVCNACRYCEAYCPVFQAMEQRTSFAKGDVMYLANLCHNCGECLYACQYAPPHEFGINVPQTLAEVRLASYEECCWPRMMSGMFRRGGVALSLGISIVSMVAIWLFGRSTTAQNDFYAVISHDVMVGIFGLAGSFIVISLTIAIARALNSFGPTLSGSAASSAHTALPRAIADVLTLRHLHATGEDCTRDVEIRTPWRRYFHHCTFYGFVLCFASTTVAAVYHGVFGWRAPYAYASVPVVLGVVGGAGLLVGPVGLLVQYRLRDRELRDRAQSGMDVSFIVMLFMTSVTGLLLLVLRGSTMMPALLVIHLGFVLGLFVTLPYGKFVHGIYRAAALLKFSSETPR
jgi:citrate/tricarballylate utilization protein